MTPEQIREEFMALPDAVIKAIFEEALSSCPECGGRGVPASWAIATYKATLVLKEEA